VERLPRDIFRICGAEQRERVRKAQDATSLSQVELDLLSLFNVQSNATQARAVLLELQLFCTGFAEQHVVNIAGLLANQERCLFLLLTLGHRRSKLQLRKTFSNECEWPIMQIEPESG